MANTRIKRRRLSRHAIFAISSHDASRVAVYRTPNYERNQSEGAAAQKDVRHDGQHDRQAPIQAIIGSKVIPTVKPKALDEALRIIVEHLGRTVYSGGLANLITQSLAPVSPTPIG